MPAVVYSETFGNPDEPWVYRQVRATGVPVVAHGYIDPDALPYENADIVPVRRSLLDVAGPLRRLRTGHSYRLPFATEGEVIDRFCERGATTIHAHRGPAGAVISGVARRLDCKLLVTFHGIDAIVVPDEERDYCRALDQLFRRADTVLAASRAVRERLRGLGCDADKIELLPPGVPLRAMRPRRVEDRGRVRATTVARLHPLDAIPELIDAVALANRMGAPLELHIVGDGPERREVERHIEATGVKDRVRLHGSLEPAERRAMLEQSDLFLLNRRPGVRSEAESLPPALLEAMGTGLCVVATRHGTIPEAVKDGVCGVLVEPSNPTALAISLVTLCKDAPLRVALGAAARAEVERDYDEARCVRRLLELYA